MRGTSTRAPGPARDRPESMLVAGIMSGTSADGIDVALAQISGRGFSLDVRTVAFHSLPYRESVRQEILAVTEAALPAARVSQLHFLLGEAFGSAVVGACSRSGVRLADLDLIGSHGQTIYHQPDPTDCCGSAVRSTLQIGEAALIARSTGAPVVSDFRPADLAAGGQGAPLVPFADYVLFRDPDVSRVALNIGGIANVTVIPAGAGPEEVSAFDTGPGNMVMDGLVGALTGGAERFDRDGRMAARGTVDEGLLGYLLDDPYFDLAPPKSTGRERFGVAFVERLLRTGLAGETLVATATQLTARSVAGALEAFAPRVERIDELVVSGGGWRNPAIIGAIRSLLPAVRVRPSDDFGVEHAAKEAVAFAILAYETYHGRPSSLPSATGASGHAVLGKVALPPC